MYRFKSYEMAKDYLEGLSVDVGKKFMASLPNAISSSHRAFLFFNGDNVGYIETPNDILPDEWWVVNISEANKRKLPDGLVSEIYADIDPILGWEDRHFYVEKNGIGRIRYGKKLENALIVDSPKTTFDIQVDEDSGIKLMNTGYNKTLLTIDYRSLAQNLRYVFNDIMEYIATGKVYIQDLVTSANIDDDSIIFYNNTTKKTEWVPFNSINLDTDSIMEDVENRLKELKDEFQIIVNQQFQLNIDETFVDNNVEKGINVTYDKKEHKLNFDVKDFNISLTGDVVGTVTVENLNDVVINTKVVDVTHDHDNRYISLYNDIVIPNEIGGIRLLSEANDDNGFSIRGDLTDPNSDIFKIYSQWMPPENRNHVVLLLTDKYNQGDKLIIDSKNETFIKTNHLTTSADVFWLNIDSNQTVKSKYGIGLVDYNNYSRRFYWDDDLLNWCLTVNKYVDTTGDGIKDTLIVEDRTLPEYILEVTDPVYVNVIGDTMTGYLTFDLINTPGNYLGLSWHGIDDRYFINTGINKDLYYNIQSTDDLCHVFQINNNGVFKICENEIRSYKDFKIDENLFVDGIGSIVGDLWTGGNLTTDENLNVFKDSYLHGDLNVDGDGFIYGMLNVYDDAYIGGDFEVDGKSTFNDDVEINGNLDVETISLNGNVRFEAPRPGELLLIDHSVTGSLEYSDLMIKDLYLMGDITHVTQEEVLITDCYVKLNSNFTSGNPIANAGLLVERGDEPQAKLYWEEPFNRWRLDDGSGLRTIVSENDEVKLVNNYWFGTETFTATFDANANLTLNTSLHAHMKKYDRFKLESELPDTWDRGVYVTGVYNGGYPSTYGHMFTIKGLTGTSTTQLFQTWNGTDPSPTNPLYSDLYTRSRGDLGSDVWTGWAKILSDKNYESLLDGRYLKLTGGTMTGSTTFDNSNITFNQPNTGILWAYDADAAGIAFRSTGDSDPNTHLEFYTRDNGNEYFKWSHVLSGGPSIELMRLVPNDIQNGLTYRGNVVYHEGNLPASDELPVGLKGQTLLYDTDYTKDVKPEFLVEEGHFVSTTSELNDAKTDLLTMEDVFNTWYKYSHSTTGVYPANASEANAWIYDSTNDVIKCTINTGTHVGFVSPDKHSSYVLEVQMTSESADDDRMGVVLAFVKIGNVEHSLVAYRNNDSSRTWCVVYNYCQGLSRREQIIADGSAAIPRGGMWDSYPLGTRIYVVRDGDHIYATTTLNNTSAPYHPAADLSINLNSGPSPRDPGFDPFYGLHVFKGPQSYGYMCQSQQYATFKVLQNSTNTQRIFDITNNETWEYDGSSWIVTAGLNSLPVGKILLDKFTKKKYYNNGSKVLSFQF